MFNEPNQFIVFYSVQNTKERLWWEHPLTHIFMLDSSKRKDASVLNEPEDAWKCFRQECSKESSSVRNVLQIQF